VFVLPPRVRGGSSFFLYGRARWAPTAVRAEGLQGYGL
jgi:hypothetical protein